MLEEKYKTTNKHKTKISTSPWGVMTVQKYVSYWDLIC